MTQGTIEQLLDGQRRVIEALRLVQREGLAYGLVSPSGSIQLTTILRTAEKKFRANELSVTGKEL